MLSAALALLAEKGLEGVTHQAVAARAGVGRATVYRHWPQPLDLQLATLSAGARPPTPRRPNVDSDLDPYAELAHPVHALAARLDEPAGSIVAAIIGRAEYDEGMRRLRWRLVTQFAESLRSGVDNAIARGQLRADLTVEGFAAATAGPLCYQRFLIGTPLDDRIVDAVVDAATRAWAPSTPPASPSPGPESA
jgi:AcrR family transcriptional regulator